MDPPPSPLGLPRELRDVLYVFAIINDESLALTISATGEGTLRSSSPLLDTSTQLRTEFLDLLSLVAWNYKEIIFHATIRDLKFSRIIAWIKSLSSSQRDRLRIKHKLHLDLSTSSFDIVRNGEDKVRAWTDFCLAQGLWPAHIKVNPVHSTLTPVQDLLTPVPWLRIQPH
jgi:hypothetical protein